MNHENCEVLIIGAGPGGYVCGIHAAKLGLNTLVVERRHPGGTCLNVGCVPSKALIHVADEYYKASQYTQENASGIRIGSIEFDLKHSQVWKQGIVNKLNSGVSGLLHRAGAQLLIGDAQVVDGKTVDVQTDEGVTRYRCEHLVLATGSYATPLPGIPFGGDVLSSTEALALQQVPNSLAVVGGGYIGLEIGTALAKLGSQVTVLEAADRLLPQYDAALTKPVADQLKHLGVDVHVNTRATAFTQSVLHGEGNGKEVDISADKVLITIGRTPNGSNNGINSLGLDRHQGAIKIDKTCSTSMRGVYAIGDITAEPMLAHRAMAQGMVVAEHIAGKTTVWDKRVIPAVCFTDPEIVVAGELPSQQFESATFPLAGNARALTMDRTDGFVRAVYEPNTQLLLGIQAVGSGVAELAGEFALAIEMCATLEDLANTIHAHPTLGETVQEIGHIGLGFGVHI